MKTTHIPLAEQLRPHLITEVIGQQHLLGPQGPLRLAFETKQLHSMILWGPPGVGKTTLAKLYAEHMAGHFIALSAVLAGVKDIREAVANAQQILQTNGKRTLLFIDEIHHFNKSQQDALLPHVESGLITFIGATTENPSFEVNSALLSRARVYVLNALNTEELSTLFERARSKYDFYVTLDAEAKTTLLDSADGDGRRLINLTEQILNFAQHRQQPSITLADLKPLLLNALRRFDKGGEQFYDQISALHKSVRGSDPDAALYWFCRMMDGGADRQYLMRRIIRMAWEDVGLADPRAIQLALDAAQTYERLGPPEGELALAQALIYLAVAPKSNAGYQAFNQAKAFVQQDSTREVPLHLRNAPTQLMKELGYGKTYRYAHDEPEAYAAGESYFPEGLKKPHWYQPTERGLEQKIKEKLRHLKALDEDFLKQQKKQ
ncbi:MAG: recombination factor protein RarA [Ferrovum sp. 37-45-19]|nr:MAG: recombination factor protein RarA [Ferrovum sp. 21-44-67]OYV95525.1 MAG: recombination factor protein RarA [Ferrovum sp. 37-45-19]HQT81323.1 replication-associated recombination protein A [Ferrovaceae bacterium]HQU05776.1 replication-associated recombination protein A [Ferrovaceae bacterium]